MMSAFVDFDSNPHSVELREVPVPEIGEEDVLVPVQEVSVCGSDVHQYQGFCSLSFPRCYRCARFDVVLNW